MLNDTNVTTVKDTSVDIDVSSVLPSGYDSVTVLSGPNNGSTTVDNTTITYTPNADFVGTDSLSYTGQPARKDWINYNYTQLGGDIDGEAAGDYSGWSVSLSSDGSVVTIGAIGNDDNGSNSGHVRVYRYDGSSWNKLGEDLDGEAAGDESLSLIHI